MTPYLLIIFAATIWGALNSVVRPLIKQGLTAGVLSVIASFIGAACLAPILFANGFDGRILHGGALALVLIDGLLEGFNVLAFCIAVKYTTTARASVAKYLAPSFLVFVFAPLILRESVSLEVAGAALLGLAGAYCMITGTSEKKSDDPEQHGRGIAFGILSAIFFGCLMAVEPKLGGYHIDAYSTMFVKLMIRGCVFGIYVGAARSEQMWPKRNQWFRIIVFGIALAVSLVCFFLGNTGLPDGSKGIVGVLVYLDLVTAVVFASLFFRDKIQKRTVLGGAFVLASGVLVTLLR